MCCTRSTLYWLVVACGTSIGLCGCIGGGQGDSTSALWRATPPGQGPRVVFDPLTRHLPEIPFPNDIATVLDSTSPTGRRLNVRTFAPTGFEEKVRTHMDELDGFGTFAPISVSFSEPIDLQSVSDETVRLIDLGVGEPYWGDRAVPVEVRNNSNFPIHIQTFPFPNDHPFPYAGEKQLLFSPDNVADLDGNGSEEMVTFYEFETNTLLIRPVIPLREATEYAVILTKGIRGTDGEAIESPFPYVAHATQIDRLERALPLLRAQGIEPRDIAFAWVFTTQTVTRLLHEVRRGMDGQGPLSFLRERYPAELHRVADLGVPLLAKNGNSYLLNAEVFTILFNVIAPLIPDLQGVPLDLKDVDYIVLGSFKTPNFRATGDTVFDVDLERGTAVVGEEEVPFVLSVPKETERFKPPFPVTLYCHGNQSVCFESLAAAETLAKHGIAVMGIDAVGHGPILTPKDLLDALSGIPEDLQVPLLKIVGRLLGLQGPIGDTVGEILDKLLGIGFVNELMVKGRAIDLSGDGYPDNGANFWTADTFSTRDVVRQTVIDLMRLLRILKSLSQEKVPPAVADPRAATPEEIQAHLLAGDFNLDGRLDVGGTVDASGRPQEYYQTGISLGGIVTSIVLGVEPGITAGVPIVPGGGLSDVMLRSELKDVMHRVYYEVLGPVILGLPDERGTVATLRFENNLIKNDGDGAWKLEVQPGGRVYGLNPRNGEDKWVSVDAGGGLPGAFTIGVAADAGDRILLTSYGTDGTELDRIELVCPYPFRGFGLDRNTPRFRRFLGLAQITMEPGDPINYAPHWFMDPLPGNPPKNVLQLSDPGDLTVPINNHIALARAGGLLGDLRTGMREAMERNEALIQRQVMLGYDQPSAPEYFPLYDVDDRDGNNCTRPSVEAPEFTCPLPTPLPPGAADYCSVCEPVGPFPAVATGAGKALVRFPFAKKHEFFGLPRGPAYVVYTRYAQNQAGAFLGSGGRLWEPEWDCMLTDEACPMTQP